MAEKRTDLPPRLCIPERLLAAMVAHCEREWPLEACGLLSGSSGLVNAVHTMTNVAASEVRYVVDARELIDINRDLRTRQEDILALYHSHPRTPAIPSNTDLRENYWDDMPRIIVSLADRPADVRIWRFYPSDYAELPWDVLADEDEERAT